MSRSQLLRAGVPLKGLETRLRRGWLHPVHRGVYRVGPVAGLRQPEMAAVLACGPGSVLGHHSAAAMWRLLPERAPRTPVHVTGSRSRRGPRRGVRFHRVRRLAREETTELDALSLTVPARTLLDLAGCTRPRVVEQAMARAERMRLTSLDELRALLDRHPRRRGRRLLASLIDRAEEPALTRSEAEERFLFLVRKGGLSAPRANAHVAGLEVDFLWRRQRLVVEIDGFEYHRGRTAFERDRGRDARLVAAGYRVMRFTWSQLTTHPRLVLAQVGQALDNARGPDRPP